MNDLIGIPYLWGGRFRAIGLDCYGLAMEAAREMGLPDLPNWTAENLADARRLMADQSISDDWVEHPRGEIVLLKRRGRVIHMGTQIYGGVLHTTRTTGSILQPLRSILRQCGYDAATSYRWRGWL